MELTTDESKQLAATFDCETSNLSDEIEKYRAAAEEEYVRMVLGQRVFTRGQDILEYRLYLLIKNVFDGRLPSEQQISSLFQTTTTNSAKPSAMAPRPLPPAGPPNNYTPRQARPPASLSGSARSPR